jgi:hypothetical protein
MRFRMAAPTRLAHHPAIPSGYGKAASTHSAMFGELLKPRPDPTLMSAFPKSKEVNLWLAFKWLFEAKQSGRGRRFAGNISSTSFL